MQDRDDKDLVRQARFFAGSEQPALEAAVEMMRRLKVTIEKADEGAKNFNQTTILLSVAVLFLTIAQIFIALLPLFEKLSTAVWVLDGLLISLLLILLRIQKKPPK